MENPFLNQKLKLRPSKGLLTMYAAAVATFFIVLLTSSSTADSPTPTAPTSVPISPAVQEWITKSQIARALMRNCKFYIVTDIRALDAAECALPLDMYASLAVQSKTLAKSTTDDEFNQIIEIAKEIQYDMAFIRDVVDIEDKMQELDRKEFPDEVKK